MRTDRRTMGESQQDIDSLLAEVSALADEAIADLGGDEGGASSAPAAGGSGTAVATTVNGPGERSAPQPPSPGPLPTHGKLQRILRLEVPVIVRLAERTLPVGKIVNLSIGAILEFDKSFDSDLDLMINNKCIGRGQAVKVGENFGLRLAYIGSLQDRIKALGD